MTFVIWGLALLGLLVLLLAAAILLPMAWLTWQIFAAIQSALCEFQDVIEPVEKTAGVDRRTRGPLGA